MQTKFIYDEGYDWSVAKALAICPLDGRYAKVGRTLAPYFSEYALVENRVKVEVLWIDFLISEVLKLNSEKYEEQKLLAIFENFDIEEFKKVKEIEAEINHDVKAVEKYVGSKLAMLGYDDLIPLCHIGCTSEDITNAAYARMIVDFMEEIYIPEVTNLIDKLADIARDNSDVAMLAHTHGQPATPTTIGKELFVYVNRLDQALNDLRIIIPYAKFNGATGNYAAIKEAYPGENWPRRMRQFVEDYLELNFNPITTQIEPHDYIVRYCDAVRHINNILTDFDVDMWLYISMEYFKQTVVKAEVGSSTMPHKVNPIKFENSESNADTSNWILMGLSNKLPKSRMQRDLTDSSSLRNLGLGFGYSYQAITSTIGGLKRVSVNTEKIEAELNDNWEVLAEPIQTILRVYGRQDAYDMLKEATRGKKMTQDDIMEFISKLGILTNGDISRLQNLTPDTYVGYAAAIVLDGME